MKKHEPGMRHRVWAALEGYELKRDWATHELRQVLPVEMGVVHAFGARDTAARDPEFFHADGPHAICGHHVKVRLAVDFPSDDEEACPRCVQLVAGGHATAPGRHDPPRSCDAIVLPDMAGQPAVVTCSRRDDHEPPHRSASGDTWELGPEDYTPTSYRP